MSSQQAKTYHSINIGTKNTWDDWGLVPTSRPLVVPPSVKTSSVDIAGGDGTLDMTMLVGDRPAYGNRSGNWEFLVMNDMIDPYENSYDTWSKRYSEIMNYLQGKSFKVILDDDPDYYYEGRLSVNTWKSDKVYSTISINYELGPYKKNCHIIDQDDWLWDPFNFENDVIAVFGSITCEGSGILTVYADGTGLIPNIIFENSPVYLYTMDLTKQTGKTYYTRSGTEGNYIYTTFTGDSFVEGVDYYELHTSDTMTMTFNGTEFTLTPGTNRIPAVVLQSGENTFTFLGYGSVSIEDTRGRL